MTKTRSASRLIILLFLFFCAVYFAFSSLTLNVNDSQKGVAYVSYKKVMKDSTILHQENQRSEKMLTLAQEAAQKKQQKYYTLPEPLRREIREIDNVNKTNRLRSEQSHARQISQKVIAEAVEKYRIEHRYSVVFNKDIVLNASEGRDISDEIIAKLQGVDVEYGELPSFEESALSQYY